MSTYYFLKKCKKVQSSQQILFYSLKALLEPKEFILIKNKEVIETKANKQAIEGVTEVSVDLETSKVAINSNNEFIVTKVKDKLSRMGYPEVGDANTILHKAKSYVSCATGKMNSDQNVNLN